MDSSDNWYNVVRELNRPLQRIFSQTSTSSTFSRVTADPESFKQFWNGDADQHEDEMRFVQIIRSDLTPKYFQLRADV
jgi:hypothetical protein